MRDKDPAEGGDDILSLALLIYAGIVLLLVAVAVAHRVL
jgi:hypothetical protein